MILKAFERLLSGFCKIVDRRFVRKIGRKLPENGFKTIQNTSLKLPPNTRKLLIYKPPSCTLGVGNRTLGPPDLSSRQNIQFLMRNPNLKSKMQKNQPPEGEKYEKTKLRQFRNEFSYFLLMFLLALRTKLNKHSGTN